MLPQVAVQMSWHHLAMQQTVIMTDPRTISEPRQVLWAFDQEIGDRAPITGRCRRLELSMRIYEAVASGVIYQARLNSNQRLASSSTVETGVRTEGEFDKFLPGT